MMQTAAVLAALIAAMALATAAVDAAQQPRIVQSLSGQWEFLPEHETEQIQSGDSYTWGEILVPALWGNAQGVTGFAAKESDPGRKLHDLSYCWYRKRFKVDPGVKGMNCLLRITDIRWSAEVWLNGVKLGEHVGAYRPIEFDATSAIRPGQENVLVIKNGGGHTIPTYEDGVPKIPFGHRGWAQGASGIMGDIELRFFRDVIVSRVKIDSDIRAGTCDVVVQLTNHGKETRRVTVRLRVDERKSGRAASEMSDQIVSIKANGTESIKQTIKLRNPHLWSPDSPFLYCLDMTVTGGDGVCDQTRETFGMREFVAKGGHFFLNGRQIYLRGATDLAITGFPSWGAPASLQTDPKWIKEYLVDNARGMNANVFRTHMGPWYKAYYDTADEYGTMIISEFPNWPPQGGKEYYHRPGFVEKLHSEFEMVTAELWNHPSIIIWAGCNEPYNFDYTDDENKFLIPFFKKLDPTRPVMRAGAVSPEIADQHNYHGLWTGTIGDHIRHAEHLKSSNPDKPLCDTEYLETSPKAFSRPEWGRAQKWMGYHVTLEKAEHIHALFAMEQTEVKRRLQFDGLLPFWYAMFMGKGKTPGEEKWQTYYALKNSMAPVAVSIGMTDRHFVAGSELRVPIWLMNDLDTAAKGDVSVYIIRDDPPYTYAGPPKSPLVTRAFASDIAPYSATPHEVTLALPSEEGSYWLYAVLNVKGRETVISKRPIYVLARQTAQAKGLAVAVIEDGAAFSDWAKSVGMDVKPFGDSGCRALVIGRNALASEAVSSKIDSIKQWVEAGGRLVILDQTAWPEGLFGLDVEDARSSVGYIFKEKGQEIDPIWQGIPDAHIEDWNGLGAVSLTHRFNERIGGAVNLAIGSAGQEGLNSRALVRLKPGKGEVLACQIKLAERLAPGATFDPVAERLMVNLICHEAAQ